MKYFVMHRMLAPFLLPFHFHFIHSSSLNPLFFSSMFCIVSYYHVAVVTMNGTAFLEVSSLFLSIPGFISSLYPTIWQLITTCFILSTKLLLLSYLCMYNYTFKNGEIFSISYRSILEWQWTCVEVVAKSLVHNMSLSSVTRQER